MLPKLNPNPGWQSEYSELKEGHAAETVYNPDEPQQEPNPATAQGPADEATGAATMTLPEPDASGGDSSASAGEHQGGGEGRGIDSTGTA